MPETITARKGKLRKKFLKTAWDLLSTKNGWEEISSSDSVAKDDIVRKVPDSGQKKVASGPQVIENNITAKAVEQVVANNVTAEEPAIEESSTEKLDFIAFSKSNLSKTQIKDFLDAKSISYKNSMGVDALIEKLFEYFNGNLDGLKESFGFNKPLNTEL